MYNRQRRGPAPIQRPQAPVAGDGNCYYSVDGVVQGMQNPVNQNYQYQQQNYYENLERERLERERLERERLERERMDIMIRQLKCHYYVEIVLLMIFIVVEYIL